MAEKPDGSLPTGDDYPAAEFFRQFKDVEPNNLSLICNMNAGGIHSSNDGFFSNAVLAPASWLSLFGKKLYGDTSSGYSLTQFQDSEISRVPEFPSSSYQGGNPDGFVPTRDYSSSILSTQLYLGSNTSSRAFSLQPLGLAPLDDTNSLRGTDAGNKKKEKWKAAELILIDEGPPPSSDHNSLRGTDAGNEEKGKWKAAELICIDASPSPSSDQLGNSNTSCSESETSTQELRGSEPLDDDMDSLRGADWGNGKKDKRKAAELIRNHASPPPSNEQLEDKVPKHGMAFSSEVAAYEFYKKYAENMGFSIRKGKVHRRSNGDISKRYLFCSKEGFRMKKPANKTTKYQRKETRMGCEAKIQLTVKNEKWLVSEVNLAHNHELVSPSKDHMSCRNFPDARAILASINEARMAEEAADTQHEEFTMDSNNFSHDRKVEILHPEDVKSFINYLKPFQVEDPSFFYTVGVDAENRIRNFFWRDGRSKIDYDYFGDVLILDTTFRMDIYGMICAPFVGVNHHRHFILLGCAFLFDETAESFIWLLETFIGAMGGRQPKTFFTDEHPEMASAVRKVLPKTQHRFFLWHIFQNAAKHLSKNYGQPNFQSLLGRCIFDCQSKEEFHSLWDSLLEQYNLHENPWLQYLYKSLEKWSHSFTKTTFSASIDSIRSGKGVTDVFCNVTSATMVLTEFAQQYENEAEQRRKKELYEDFRENRSPITLTGSLLEKQAANVYTNAVFELFQEELNMSQALAIEEIASGGAIAAYKLTEGHKKESIVAFNCADRTVTCSCKKFESDGILCVHALKVLNARNIFEIPTQYILNRWTKYAKYGVMDDSGEEMIDKRKRPMSLDNSKLKHIALNVITKCTTKDTMAIAEHHFKSVLKEVEEILKTKDIEDLEVDSEVVTNNTNGFGCLETQKVVLKSPCVDLEEISKASRMRSQKKKERKERARDIKRKSCDEANTHHQPPIKLARGVDEGSSGGLSHSNSVGGDPSKHANPQTEKHFIM